VQISSIEILINGTHSAFAGSTIAAAMPALTRRQKFVLIIMMGAAQVEAEMTRNRGPNVHRDRFGAMVDIIHLTDKQFKCRFRMNRMRYSALLAEIRQDLERNEAQAIRSSGEPVYPYLQLAIGLRYLAGGSYLDIADVYKVCCRVIQDGIVLICFVICRLLNRL
jgi:hypothetical protein